MRKWKLVSRHKHLEGITISEMLHTGSLGLLRRYVATIRGYRGFDLAQGIPAEGDFTFDEICQRAIEIRDRIDSDDESVFFEKTTIYWGGDGILLYYDTPDSVED